MKITTQAWETYIRRLAKLNEKAAQLMAEYLAAHGTADTEALIDYAAALVQKYGEGSAELACQMYDAMGGVQMSVAGHTGPMWIDCDLQDAYYNNTNLNKYLTAPEFPVLGAGATQVSWSGGIDKCEVVPRWWRL